MLCCLCIVIICCADYAFDFVAEDGIGYVPKRPIEIKKKKKTQFIQVLMSAYL